MHRVFMKGFLLLWSICFASIFLCFDAYSKRGGPLTYNVDNERNLISFYPDTEIAIKAYIKIGTVSSCPIFSEYKATEEAYKYVVDHYPENKYADDTLWYLAKFYEWNLEDYEKALNAYNELLAKYGKVVFEDHPLVLRKVSKNLDANDLKDKINSIETKLKEIKEIKSKIKNVSQVQTEPAKPDEEQIALCFKLADKYTELGALYHAEATLKEILHKYCSLIEVQSRAHFFLGELYRIHWIERIKDPFGEVIFRINDGKMTPKTKLLNEALKNYKAIYATEWKPRALFEEGIVFEQIGYKWVCVIEDIPYEICGDYQNAIDRFERVYREYPKHELAAKALYEAALLYKKLGKSNFDKSQEAYNKIIHDYPSSDIAQKAKQELKNEGAKKK